MPLVMSHDFEFKCILLYLCTPQKMPPTRRLHLESLMRGDILGLAGPRSMASTILSTSEVARLWKLVAGGGLLEVVAMLRIVWMDFSTSLY